LPGCWSKDRYLYSVRPCAYRLVWKSSRLFFWFYVASHVQTLRQSSTYQKKEAVLQGKNTKSKENPYRWA
jgi:hypothetical protein